MIYIAEIVSFVIFVGLFVVFTNRNWNKWPIDNIENNISRFNGCYLDWETLNCFTINPKAISIFKRIWVPEYESLTNIATPPPFLFRTNKL